MNASEERFHHSALIPWVFALVALIGCNALLPNLAQARKGRDLDGCSLTQVTGDSPAPGAQSQPGVVLAPGGTSHFKLTAPPSSLLEMDPGEVPRVVSQGRGAARGRAPPELWNS
jgi:hypothetical protein